LTAARELLSEHMLLAVAIVIFVEELGIPLLVPGDILMILAGIEVARGHASLPQVLLIEEAATVAGATLLFLLSRRIGRPALMRFGRYVGMDHQRVEVAEERLRHYQFRAVVVGRLVPGLRVVIVIAAGLAGLDSRRFVPALALGAFVYLLGNTLLGMYAGEAAIEFIDRLAIPVSAGISIVALGFLALGLRAASRSKRLAPPIASTEFSGLVAGLVAAIAALLASTVVRGFLLVGARLLQSTPAAPVNTGRLIGLLLNWPGFLVFALIIAVAVPVLGLRDRPLPVRLVVTVVVPFLLTMLFVNPTLAGRALGWGTGAHLTSAAIALARWGTFAATLEYLHRLMFEDRRERA